MFKPGLKEYDFFRLDPMLIAIYGDFVAFCMRKFGVRPSITSMLRRNTTDNGVHATGRAIDLSHHEYDPINGKRLETIPIEHCQKIADAFNIKYPRTDGKLTVLWHFGSAWHWHIQTAFNKSFEKQEYENKIYVSSNEP